MKAGGHFPVKSHLQPGGPGATASILAWGRPHPDPRLPNSIPNMPGQALQASEFLSWSLNKELQPTNLDSEVNTSSRVTHLSSSPGQSHNHCSAANRLAEPPCSQESLLCYLSSQTGLQLVMEPGSMCGQESPME